MSELRSLSDLAEVVARARELSNQPRLSAADAAQRRTDIAIILEHGVVDTNRALAELLDVSPPRVTQILKTVRIPTNKDLP